MAAFCKLSCFSMCRPFLRKNELSRFYRRVGAVSHFHTRIAGSPRSTCGNPLTASLQRSRHGVGLQQITALSVAHRFNSTDTVGISPASILTDVPETPYIPEPPAVPVEVTIESTVGDVAEILGEPTFASMELGGWMPIGIIQNCLEFLHVGLDMPWFAAIAVGTIVAKTLLFPLIIYGQRNSAKMNNNMPKMQELQLKMSEARRSGDSLEASKCAHALMVFMKEKDINPLKGMLIPLLQAPVFISFFIGLRQMATLPVESMTIGGLYWFTNLTLPDPFYILPLITSATLFLTVELGIESGMRADNLKLMKYFLRAMPLIILPFTINFPAAVLCYWMASNFFSLAQVAFLRHPSVRKFFNIEALVKHPAKKTPLTSKSFVDSVKDTWTNAVITREMEDRGRLDEMRFRKAGLGPIQKTYRYDPTNQSTLSAKISSSSSGSNNNNHPVNTKSQATKL